MLLQLLPVLAYAAAVAAVMAVAAGARAPSGLWRLPAAAAALFWLQSLVTVGREGLMQFWVNHTSNLTGNQVWFDLLAVVVIAFAALAPRARARGMRLVPWGLATVLLAGLALLPMLARLMWLEERAAAPAGAAGAAQPASL